MPGPSGVPTVREELNRKTFESIEWLYERLRAGQIHQAQFSTGVHTLFSTASGLVDEQFLDVVTAASDLCDKAPLYERRCFEKDGETAVLTWRVGEERLVVARVGVLGREDKSAHFDSPAKAREALGRAADKLYQQGWVEF